MNKKEFIKFRCTSLEKAIIKKKAKNTGLSMSEFSRASALGQTIKSKFTQQELFIPFEFIQSQGSFAVQ